MSVYKYAVGKKLLKNPMRIADKITISCSNELSILNNFIEVESLDDIMKLLKEKEYNYIEFIKVSQNDFNNIIDLVSNHIQNIDLFMCNLDLLSLSKCIKLKEVSINHNDKLESLWNLEANKELFKLSLVDCQNLKDITGIKDSSLSDLEIKKNYRTVPDVLDIEITDFSIFSSLKNLKNLTLFVLENDDKEKDLLALSQLTQLESLYLPREYFSFEQFAWLKSKLKDTKNLDCIYYLAKDPANERVVAMIIGKGEPDWLYDDGSDYKEYHDRYAKLIQKS